MILAVMGATPELLGYPVFVRIEGGKCSYVIQDMIISKKRDAREWMKDLPDKERQIDIVWSVEADRACVGEARKLVRGAGFSNIVVRNEVGVDYSSGLPPT